MEATEKLPTDAGSERLAEQFYEQALLLVDCCRIPEAIRLLEQAIKVKPDSEIYRESLAILQLNYLQSEQQGLSYANVARPRSNMGDGKENISSNEWKAKKTRSKENQRKMPWSPASSSSCYSNHYEQSTIDNPWASFVNRNSKGKKSEHSPIDGLSEIEIPLMDEHFYTESPGSKQEYKHCDYKEHLSMPISCSGSQKYMHKDGMSVNCAQDNHVKSQAGKYEGRKSDYPEDHCTDSNESLDTKFLEELCMARESATDDWAKYYDMLCSGLGEDATCNQSDVSHLNTLSYQEYSDTLDELNATEDVKCSNRSGKDHSKSERTASMYSNSVCSKCGHLKDCANPPSPTKNRIHFVNGACVSSSSTPNCTCNKERKSCSKEKSAKLPLSSSQQEFYRNLQFYFGSGKVQSRKATADAENDSRSVKSSDLHQKSSTSCRTCDTNVSPTAAKDPLNVKSNQNVSETVQNSTQGESKKERTIPTRHVSCKVTGEKKCSESRKAKISFNADELKTDKKSCSGERFHPVGYKQKARAHNKVRCKTKAAVKTEPVKIAKEGASQGNDSQKRQSTVEDGIRSRSNHMERAEDTSRPVVMPETSQEKPRQKQKEEKTSEAGIDFIVLLTSVYLTGLTVALKCFQVSKSILYYIFLLMILLFGFLIYCVWFAAFWLIRKVFHLIAIDKLLAFARSKTSDLLEWLRKCRETQRKTSAQGQTYDLPKNGDAAIRHMLQNKDNDPYSVLGVPSDASDDDIRKQYRKLAVLIHPDKNPHSQADEAFKILASAFDVLSDAEKRSDYDREAAWKRRAEEREGRFGHHPASPEQFFADLGKKMQEMQNYLQCNSCDGKHRRYSTDRFVLTARFCGRCNTRHAAKEGDLWAESSFLGYKLHFYACMEGEVFDVTEWAACQGIGDYRLEPNPHTVHLKLKTRHPHPSGFNSRSEEEDFENFMRAFFGQFNPSKDERYQGSNKQPKRKRKKRR